MQMISPWIDYYREIEALFGKDPEITVEYDANANEIKLRVRNQRKADALTALLPVEKEICGVKIKVTVIPENVLADDNERLFQAAFDGNPALKEITKVHAYGGQMLFIEFVPEVVQYHNDDIGDLHGNRSTLYADIAKDVFDVMPGTFFCTGEVN